MRAICFYFQVHQPFRLRTYRFFDIGEHHQYYDDFANRSIMRKVAEKCYLPTNRLMLDLIAEFGQRFKISYSISGTAIEQFEKYAPDVLDSFKALARTGSVEFLSETYAHALAALKSPTEFKAQVDRHRAKMEEHFGISPKTFRNTELIYSDEIGKLVYDLGYDTMLTEGAKHIMGWRSPNYLYCSATNQRLKLLLKNFKLSDDIAFRFSSRAWDEWPLTTEKYVGWLNQVPENEEIINLFMDYETFGEHQWADTGIFEFMRALPGRVFSDSNYRFLTPAEASEQLQPIAPLYVPFPISWADEERDLTAWLGNELQDEAFAKLYELEHTAKAHGNEHLLRDWTLLQTSDHFYYMCTKFFNDGDVHKYFNHYDTPYQAYINFMNVLSDFKIRLEREDNKPLMIESADISTPEPAVVKKKASSKTAKTLEKSASNHEKKTAISQSVKGKTVKKSSGNLEKKITRGGKS